MPDSIDPGPSRSLTAVLAAHSEALMSIDGVVGLAEGEFAGEPAVVVLTAGLTRQDRERIPPRLAGYIVVVRETGAFEALNA